MRELDAFADQNILGNILNVGFKILEYCKVDDYFKQQWHNQFQIQLI